MTSSRILRDYTLDTLHKWMGDDIVQPLLKDNGELKS